MELIMATFMEATRIKNSIKMKLSQKAWFNAIRIEYKSGNSGYCVVIYVDKINDEVKRFIPSSKEGVDILLESK